MLVLVLEVRVLESTVSRGIWNCWEGKFWRGLWDLGELVGRIWGNWIRRRNMERAKGFQSYTSSGRDGWGQGVGIPGGLGVYLEFPHAPVPSAPRQKPGTWRTLLDIRGLRPHGRRSREILAVTRDLESLRGGSPVPTSGPCLRRHPVPRRLSA